MNTFLWSFYKCAGLAEVATVGVLYDGKLLMGKRRDNGRWTNPGGHLDPGEDPVVGAKRELYEEAGIKADKLTHLVSKEVTTPKGKRIIVHTYKYEPTTLPATSMKKDPDLEVHRWQWVSTSHGLPPEVADNLHSPKNVLLQALGLQKMTKEASVKDFFAGFEKRAIEAKTLVRGVIGRVRAKGPLSMKLRTYLPGKHKELENIYQTHLDKVQRVRALEGLEPKAVKRRFYREAVDEMNRVLPSDAVKRRHK